ncbi:unnamed protein product [Arctia plantaginis]|uniref:Uncharacterized protein n=1 Tax=Arctia plantaginis TaxID=874455 RepID=A0A8S0ZQ98_ARCPL|nr:unnamed protein product [Arctia plantaginis]
MSVDTLETNMNTVVSEKTTVKQDLVKEDQIGECLKFKKTKRYDVNKIADVWKITFYTIPTTLKCFRLHIKKVSFEDQKRYEATYGDFDDKVKWRNCILEITSSENKRFDVQRRHFLQKNDLQNGVMENIIIDQERNGNTTSVLHEESPDQWLVVKNLLLMRDCNTGDVVVFSRVPSEPLMNDIEDALVEFGESGPINGTRACEGFVKAWVKVG